MRGVEGGGGYIFEKEEWGRKRERECEKGGGGGGIFLKKKNGKEKGKGI